MGTKRLSSFSSKQDINTLRKCFIFCLCLLAGKKHISHPNKQFKTVLNSTISPWEVLNSKCNTTGHRCWSLLFPQKSFSLCVWVCDLQTEMRLGHTDDPLSALQINTALEGKYPPVPNVYFTLQTVNQKENAFTAVMTHAPKNPSNW